MIYAERIENNKLGDWTKSTKVAKHLGWTIQLNDNEVEQSEMDGAWYLAGFAPKFTEEERTVRKLAEIQKELTDIVQSHMDETAQTRGYDNIHTACSYATSTDPIFNREGNACLAWRDAVWRKCYTMLDEFKAGTREIPTAEELLAELPALDWGDNAADENVSV